MRTNIRSVRTTAASRVGFTVVELLVVIAVIGVLAAIMIPAIQSARETSRRTTCKNNLRQMGVATHAFLTTNQRFPSSNERYFSFLVALLPMLEQTSLYEEIHQQMGPSGWTSDVTMRLSELERRTAIELYHCPADPDSGPGITNYLGNSGSGFESSDGAITEPSSRPAQFADGMSNTALASEFVSGMGRQPVILIDMPADDLESWKNNFVPSCEAFVEPPQFPGALMGVGWITPGYPVTTYAHILAPGKNSCRPSGATAAMIATPRSHHPLGVNTLFADGHVRFISRSTDQTLWRSFGSGKDAGSIWD